jgi:hypothetical protein
MKVELNTFAGVGTGVETCLEVGVFDGLVTSATDACIIR